MPAKKQNSPRKPSTVDNSTIERRDFLKQGSAVIAASAAIPYIFTASSAYGGIVPQERPTVAAIGVGGSRGRHNRGGGIARDASNHADVIAVCDVDHLHMDEFAASEKFKDREMQKIADYRELLEKVKPDIVTIGTPDHWHIPISIAAMNAGCDVYCEKPLTLTINEGKEIREVVKQTGKVFQVGTQQRSSNENRFLKAIAMVQGGYIGDNVNAIVAIGGAPGGGPFESTEAPEDLDWDFWVGPAREMDYSVQRRKEFRWFFEYSGGKMTDWGAHHIDIAQWALGCTSTGPGLVTGTGKFPDIVPADFDWVGFFAGTETLPNGHNTATQFSIDLSYANGCKMTITNHYKSEDEKTEFGNGILFTGSTGRIFVNRNKLEGKPVQDLTEDQNKDLDVAMADLYRGMEMRGHMRNFFDCIENRTDPISDVYTHHRTMTTCHLCNINLMLGRDLNWDPETESFVDDEVATALMSRPSREKFLAAVAAGAAG